MISFIFIQSQIYIFFQYIQYHKVKRKQALSYVFTSYLLLFSSIIFSLSYFLLLFCPSLIPSPVLLLSLIYCIFIPLCGKYKKYTNYSKPILHFNKNYIPQNIFQQTLFFNLATLNRLKTTIYTNIRKRKDLFVYL